MRKGKLETFHLIGREVNTFFNVFYEDEGSLFIEHLVSSYNVLTFY